MRRTPKGTYVRNTWDWLVAGNAITTVNANVGTPNLVLAFQNLGMGYSNYDLYHFEMDSTGGCQIGLFVGQNIGATAPPLSQSNRPVDPAGTPPQATWVTGAESQFTTITPIKLATNQTLISYSLDLNAGSFARLWPTYCLCVLIGLTTAATVACSLFYQQISDVHGRG